MRSISEFLRGLGANWKSRGEEEGEEERIKTLRETVEAGLSDIKKGIDETAQFLVQWGTEKIIAINLMRHAESDEFFLKIPKKLFEKFDPNLPGLIEEERNGEKSFFVKIGEKGQNGPTKLSVSGGLKRKDIDSIGFLVYEENSLDTREIVRSCYIPAKHLLGVEIRSVAS